MGDLGGIASQLKKGKTAPEVTVREFLSWFGAKRRGYWIVREIREQLGAANLQTVPDFESEWIDAHITFSLRKPAQAETVDAQPVAQGEGIALEAPSDVDDPSPIWVTREATYRISRLDTANKPILACTPDEHVSSIVTKMMKGGFSQLPVMTGERSVKGVVSWQTIGTHLALGAGGETAKDLMEAHQEISSDRSIFDAISIIVAADYVLVKDSTGKITGIITAADLSLQFRELTEPFLLLSEIEGLIRNLIGENFALEELKASCDSTDEARLAKVKTVADLTFGEYVRLLENQERWDQLGLKVDRKLFCGDLDAVREIRNDVMHFDPDGIDPDDLTRLREFTRFLQQIARVTKSYSM